MAAAVKREIGDDGRALAETFGKLWRGEKIDGWERVTVKDRLEAGKWLADRGFGRALDITSQLTPEQAGALLELDDQTLQAVVTGIKSHLSAVKADRSPQATDGQQPQAEIPRKVA